MTTTWPLAPSGSRWWDLDGVLDTVDTLVRTEARTGSVHQVRWEPAGRTRVAFERIDGDTVVLEADDAGITVHALAEDAALPGLAEVLDPSVVRSRLQGCLPHPVRRCAVTVVSYRPESRCVVRYAVRGPANEGSLLYAKLLAHDADVCLETHVALSRAIPGCVPRIVVAWPELSAFVTEAVPGRSVSAVLGDRATLRSERTRLARALGSLLATVHSAQPGALAAGRLHTEAMEVEELSGYLEAAWQADAEAALSVGWLVRGLDATRPPAARRVLGHGSFRAGQVVVSDDGLVLLDLDAAGLAAPERDLGNALAYLDWRVLRDPGRSEQDLTAAVVDGYLESGGEVDRAALAWWHAASLVKIAGRRYRSLDTAHWGAVPSLLSAARDVLDAGGDDHDGSGRYRSGRGRLCPGSAAEISDARAMSGILRGVLDHLGTDPAGGVSVTESTTVRIAAGRRVVERYRLSGAREGDVEILLKAYAEPERAAIAHENLGAFAALTDPHARVGTPAPVGHLADRGIVVCRAVTGRAVTELADDEVARDAAARCGRWLRDVHGSGMRLARRLDLSREVSNLALWSAQIGRVEPRLARSAQELAETLAVVATRLPLIRTAAIHKDLHLDHVIVDAAGWAWVIDLDEARMGDPAFDVAHLTAYAQETGTGHAGEAFAAAYGELDGPDVDLRLAYFTAYTLLKITKQQVRAHGPDDERAERGAARLTRGVSWLTE